MGRDFKGGILIATVNITNDLHAVLSLKTRIACGMNYFQLNVNDPNTEKPMYNKSISLIKMSGEARCLLGYTVTPLVKTKKIIKYPQSISEAW